ncbi:alphaB-crystallin [Aphelenchoides avenae]|nr:alphaB-crystallin [Aphelenchus avenae]
MDLDFNDPLNLNSTNTSLMNPSGGILGPTQTDTPSSWVSINNDEFVYKVDLGGFPAKDIEVDQQGDELVLHGRHVEQGDSSFSEQAFENRVRVPAGIVKDTIRCQLDDSGCLLISGKRDLSAIEQQGQDFIPLSD